MSTRWEELIAEAQAAARDRKYGNAEELFRAALDVAEKMEVKDRFEIAAEAAGDDPEKKIVDLPDSRPALISMTWEHLADLYVINRRRPEAEAAYLKALEIRRQHLGPRHHKVAKSLFDLAGLCFSEQRYAESESYHRDALELARDVLEEGDVAMILHSLGTLYLLQVRSQDAIAPLREALDLRVRQKAANPFDVLATENLLAEAYEAQGDVDAACRCYTSVLQRKKASLGAEHIGLVATMQRLTNLLESSSRFAEALEYETMVLEIQRRKLQDPHPLIADTLQRLVRLESEVDEYDAALDHQERLVAMLEKILGKNSPELIDDLEFLGQLYEYLDRTADAEKINARVARLEKKRPT